MTLVDLIPELKALPRPEKLWVIQMMAADVASEEGFNHFISGQEHEIWSPFDAYEGAAVLMRALDEEKAKE